MRDIRETNGAGPGDLGVRRGHGGSFRCEAETCVGSYFLQTVSCQVEVFIYGWLHPRCLHTSKSGMGKFHGACSVQLFCKKSAQSTPLFGIIRLHFVRLVAVVRDIFCMDDMRLKEGALPQH